MARWDEILTSVFDNIEDAGMERVIEPKVLRELGKVEIDIARRGLAIQGKGSLVTAADEDEYAVAASVFKIAKIFTPNVWRMGEIEVVESEDRWAEIIREPSLVSSWHPLFAILWQDVLQLYKAPSESGVTVSFWSYDVPTVKPVGGADPTVKAMWDDALEWGATWRLLKKTGMPRADEYLAMYEREIAKKREEELRKTFDGLMRRESSFRRLKF